MKNLLKVSCLVVALLATVAMVGCGGGGGGGGNPAAPVNTTSNEARAAQEAVSPVLQNADTILGINVNASSRASTSDIQEFSVTSTNNAIMSAFEAPELIRAVIEATGGNIDSGLWVGTENGFTGYIEVASYSNNVYERTLYLPYYNENEPIKTAHYLIEGCKCELDGTTLKSFTFNPNAKITIEQFYDDGNLKNLIKGTIDTDLKANYEVSKEEDLKDTYIDIYNGEKISLDNYYGSWAFKATQKITSKVTYTLNKPIVLKLVNSFGTKHSYNHWMNWNNDNPNHITELTENKFSTNNLNITISGFSGTITTPSKTTFYGNSIGRHPNTGEWADYKDIYGEESYDDASGFAFSSGEKPVYNLKYANPCEVSINGDITNKKSFGSDNTGAYWDSIETTPIANRSGTINNVNVKLRNVSGNLDSIVVGDAEAYVDIGDYKQDQAIKIGNYEVVFNKAKVTVTGLKYDYRWKPKSEQQIYQPDTYMWQDNEEYKKETEAMRRNCFGNSKVHLDAEETKNSVTIKADCDINKKTANLNLINNGDLIVKEDTLQFNFKTVEIKATNADILADNKCEGAILKVTGVEKDGTKSERTYNVVKGKLVLDTKSQKDKQAPESLPTVDIKVPTEIADSNSVEVAVSEANPSEEVKTSDTNATLKVGKKGDLKVASYEKKATKTTDKKLSTKISAKDKIIAAVSFYGDNEYTLVFVIDYSDEKHPQIKGSIFKGKVNNKTMDSPDRIAQFAGKDGKITVIGPNGTSEVAVQ